MHGLHSAFPGRAEPLNTSMGWIPQYLDELDPSIPGWAGPLNTWMGWTPQYLDGLIGLNPSIP
ncbi:MAG: hypothetical protein ACK56I_27510, partial [bacterium]